MPLATAGQNCRNGPLYQKHLQKIECFIGAALYLAYKIAISKKTKLIGDAR